MSDSHEDAVVPKAETKAEIGSKAETGSELFEPESETGSGQKRGRN
jgi:hypothetical protein